MDSKATSKTSSLKALLLRAWRERWTDVQWGINIKTVLPRGVSGDVYDLADCILSQASVGSGANQLALSYLKHSLSVQLVSHAAVLKRLSKFENYDRVHCLTSLLEFLEGMLSGVTCYGKPEETVLATAVLSTANGLVNILLHCRDAGLKEKTNQILRRLLTDDFYIAMICLAKYNNPELLQEIVPKCTQLLATLPEAEERTKFIRMLENIDIHMLRLPVCCEKWPGTLIQSWLQVQLVGNPGTDTSTVLYKLQILQRLKGYSYSRLCAELIRGCLVSLLNVFQIHCPHQSQLSAFIFLNLPHFLQELSRKSEDSNTVVNALEMVLEHSQLLDTIDANDSCTIFNSLLNEFAKVHLITEDQAKMLLDKRKAPTTLKCDNLSSTSMDKVIRCAQSSLSGILKTLLCSDYNKIREAMLGMLHHVLIAKSFELIVAVACSSDQLKTLVAGLIQFTEWSKLAQEDSSLELFDISFVMLIAIMQNYGASPFLDSDGDSLIDRWLNSFLVDSNNPKAPTQLLSMSDPVIVEALIQQFNAGDSELKPSMTLQDILFNMPGVMHEVLVAWEQGALAASDVKRILDAVREKTTCLPIAAATYLCSYMRTAPPETLLKPMNMVQQLLSIPTALEEQKQEESRNEEGDNEGEESNRQRQTKLSLRDRWYLTCDIIRKLQKDIQLPTMRSSHHLVSKSPATEWLHNAWNRAVSRGWLDYNSTKIMQCLFSTAGPRWLVNAVVQELMKLKFRDQLQRGVDLALSIFHADIVACAIELLSHILPQLLYVDVQTYSLMEPQLSALAYLSCFCIYTAWDSVADEQEVSEPPIKVPRFDNLDQQSTETPAKKLIHALLQLLAMYEKLQDGGVTPQTYFIFNLVKALVEVKIDSANALLNQIPASLISDLLKSLPDEFSYSMLLHLHDVTTNTGRVNMAKDICVLRNYHLRHSM
ncbi:hypothetical protein ABEB36_001452 [Hypothenemus hampei]|uniref:Mediator of RNA polymerase II transcription subunit 24 n=1 Tax=Hypothenemus hampei TaxID=57062 RepID=A0ABD1FHU4_HYPHA